MTKFVWSYKGLKNHQAQMQRQLTCNIMSRLAALCKELPGFAVASELFVLSWSFLLRVQSEGVPLEAGTDAELRSLPPYRHSAIVLMNWKTFTCACDAARIALAGHCS